MSIIKVDYGTVSGVGASLTQTYSPTANEGRIESTSIPVTSGKTYIIVGTTNTNGVGNTYSVSGGDLLDMDISKGAGLYGGVAVYSVVLLVKATSSSITISVSGSTPYLFSGQVEELG